MDFVEGLPKSQGKSVIFVVVDKLSKYGHFIPLAPFFTTTTAAKVHMKQVYKLHGLPQTIVSDRDPVFLSKLWTKLFTVQGDELYHSTAYHPQVNEQIKEVNRCIETYLNENAERINNLINYNMRCIETFSIAEYFKKRKDKLQHEMY